MTDFPITQRNRVRSHADRARYDRATIYAIVDEALICHIGFVQDGQPYVIPTLHARRGDELLVHGAPTGRLIRHLAAGHEVCVAVTVVESLLPADAACNFSIAYRSAVLFGRGRAIEAEPERVEALAFFAERFARAAGRQVHAPGPADGAATAVAAITIAEASAKIH